MGACTVSFACVSLYVFCCKGSGFGPLCLQGLGSKCLGSGFRV